jgi:hypothetical protein
MFAKLKQGLPEPELATGAGVSSAAMSAEAGDASAAFTPEGSTPFNLLHFLVSID